MSDVDPLAAGRTALRRGDGAAARAAFEAADGVPPAELADCLAQAAYLEHDTAGTVRWWRAAYGAYRAAGDHLGAVRSARSLAGIYVAFVGDAAVAAGWLARARTLLGPDESAEAGWVSLDIGMFERDRGRRDDAFRRALDLARRFGDQDLEVLASAYLGANLVHDDRIDEGMVLLDEALAAVAGGDVDDFRLLEEIFCQLFAACEHAQDVTRAEQWMRTGTALAEQGNLPTVAAFCHTHYGGILTAAGRWSEADSTLSTGLRLWDLAGATLRAGALCRLADLRVRQGRLEEAARLLAGLDTDFEAARPLAALRLARGEPALAVDVLERALVEVDRCHTAATPLLGLLVEAHLATGAFEAAAATAQDLVSCARSYPGLPHVRAEAALALGRVAVAGDGGDAQSCLREAVAGFARAQLPMELARSRLALAQAVQERQPEVAVVEARAALASFERLDATRDAAAAAAVLRSLGVRPASPSHDAGVLTRREREVLDLIGAGLGNREIGERLYISRKTVEHHVGNILTKLGLRGRAEAAVYATRTEPGSG